MVLSNDFQAATFCGLEIEMETRPRRRRSRMCRSRMPRRARGRTWRPRPAGSTPSRTAGSSPQSCGPKGNHVCAKKACFPKPKSVVEDVIRKTVIIFTLTLHPMQTPPPSILPSVLMLPLSASTFKDSISVKWTWAGPDAIWLTNPISSISSSAYLQWSQIIQL